MKNSLLTTQKSDKLAGQEKVAHAKARVIYDILNAHPEVYQDVPRKNAGGKMNIYVRVYEGDVTSQKAFLAGAEEPGAKGPQKRGRHQGLRL